MWVDLHTIYTPTTLKNKSVLPVFPYPPICSCLLSFRLLAMTRTMQVEVLDRVLGELNALVPSEIDTVAIVNATPDPAQAEEHPEIIEGTGRHGEAGGAGRCLAGQCDGCDILAVEVLEHFDDGSGLEGVIGRVFRMCRRRNQREPGRVL